MNDVLTLIPKESVIDGVIALTTEANLNMEITKKGVDVARDSIKSVGKGFKQFKSHLPLVALIMNLVGYGLSVLACCLDTTSPIWFRALSAVALVLMAIGACAIFSFSVSNPVFALGIGLAMIATNVVLKGFETAIEVIKLVRFKRALNAPANPDKTEKLLANAQTKQAKLEKKLDALLFELGMAKDSNKKEKILGKISKTQAELYTNKQNLYQLNNPSIYFKSQITLQKQEVRRKIRGLGFCVLGSCLGVAGLFLAPLYPILGIVITIGSFALDGLGLYRKIRAKLRGFKTQKRKKNEQVVANNEQLISSISRLNNQEIQNKATYASVMTELKSLAPANAGDYEQPITPVYAQMIKSPQPTQFFGDKKVASNDENPKIEDKHYHKKCQFAVE